MDEKVIRAIERTEKSKKARRDGFAPGIVYGKELEQSIPVKFDMKELKRMLKGHCSNNVISVKINKDIIDCIVKDLQSDSVTGEIIHIDLQTVDKNRYVKLKVPVKFKGKEKLQAQGLVLQVIKPEITVKGSIDLIPDSISVNVEDKKLGDHVIIQDCQINKNLKVLSEPNILAIVVSQDKMDMVS